MLHHIIIDLPDDEIVDNRIESKVTYLAAVDGKIESRTAEGFILAYSPEEELAKHIDLSAIKIGDEDVLLFKYDSEIEPEDAQLIKDVLQNEFPKNKVLGITNSIELLSMYPKEAIEMLNKMIAHIKIVNI